MMTYVWRYSRRCESSMIRRGATGTMYGAMKRDGGHLMVIEAGVVAAYMIAWAMRKARRVAGRLDAEADEAIDAGLDRLHEAVVAKLGEHPALHELDEESAAGPGQVSELTRQQLVLAITAAARKDEAFGRVVTELVVRLQHAEQTSGRPVMAGAGSAVFTGDAHAQAKDGGIAVGQVAGDFNVHRDRMDPTGPGKPGL
jgi:hypothetical protein